MNSDEWVMVRDDLPQLDRNMKNCSIDVLLLTIKNNRIKGFYNYENDVWYNLQGYVIRDKVIAWQSLE